MSEPIPQFLPIADGCFRDTTRLIKNADGKFCFFEFTPFLNSGKKVKPADAAQLVADCPLAGGGWQQTTVQEEVALRHYAKFDPASDVPDSPDSGYVLTRDVTAWSPSSGYVWAVYLGSGYVTYVDPYDGGGFVRGGRLVPASQKDLAVGL